jgi:hypothetical protein
MYVMSRKSEANLHHPTLQQHQQQFFLGVEVLATQHHGADQNAQATPC